MLCHALTTDHVLNLARRKLADGVGDGDVGTASRGLLSSSDLEDTVDIDLENNLENGISGYTEVSIRQIKG
jgi:hypothetical protein